MLPSIKTLLRTAVMAAAALACTYSLAARDFTPQAGTWIISSELDGKPGRGLAIDVQGNTFFMQVFGYEKNGDATFYTATGQMDGNQVTAPLMRYRGGRSFGGTARDAVEDQSVGDVTVSFKNGLKGTVQFPGEEAVAIERFLVQESGPSIYNPAEQVGARSLDLFVQDELGQFVHYWKASLSRRSEDQSLILALSAPINSDYMVTSEFFQTLECTVVSGQLYGFDCLKRVGSEPENAVSQASARIQSLRLRILGADVSGSVVLEGAKGQPRRFTGSNNMAMFSGSNGPESATYVNVQQNYSWITSFGSATLPRVFHTLMPMTGTWIISDELTGKPSRGLALDVQGSHAILQVFNYRPDGRAVFHMGSAVYGSNGADTQASSAQVPMDEYEGGRSLGGAPKAAQWRSHAGVAGLNFTTKAYWRRRGTIQLPGEPEVAIQRLRLDTPTRFADRLLGTWYLPVVNRFMHLVHVEGDVLTNADRSIVCQPVTHRSDADVSCGQPLAGGGWQWHQFLRVPTEQEGNGSVVRLRDRFGNALGLGLLD